MGNTVWRGRRRDGKRPKVSKPFSPVETLVFSVFTPVALTRLYSFYSDYGDMVSTCGGDCKTFNDAHYVAISSLVVLT